MLMEDKAIQYVERVFTKEGVSEQQYKIKL